MSTKAQQKAAFRALILSKLGGEAKSRAYGHNRPHCLESYIIEANGAMDDTTLEAATITSLIALFGRVARSGKPIEEVTIRINETEPLDLIDEIGVSYSEIMQAATGKFIPEV